MNGRLVAVVSAAVLVGLTACGGGSTQGTPAGGQCTAERAGGSVTMGTYSAPQGLDPVGQPGGAVTGGTEITALFDTLMDFDPETQSYVPRVAESLTADAAKQVWTMTLQPGIRFGNGDPLTADDVKASIARHQAPENTQVSRGDAITIAQMDVVDPRTVRFTLDSPYPLFPRVLATDVGMVTNPRVVAERGPAGFATNVTGGGVGPYELERYAPGDEIVLKAKSDYWDGPVCVQTLRFINIPGAHGTFDALRNGELDVALLREPQVVDEARKAGFDGLSTLYNVGEAVIMNSASGRPTADVLVRRAVVAAVDPESVNKRVYDGTAFATSALIHPDTPGLYSGRTGPAYDPAQARQLVEQAKAAGWNGTVRLLSDSSRTRVDEAIAVKAQLEVVGFQVQTDSSQAIADVLKRVVVDRDYDLALWGPQFSTEGLWSIMNRQLGSKARSNYYAYADPQMDTVLADLRQAATPDEQKPILARAQDILTANPFAANLAALEEVNIHDTRLNGLILGRASIVRFDKAYVNGR